jgi:penicillin-binding protein 2
VKGVEALYESILRGHDGSDFTVVDARGRRVNQEQWKLLPKTVREDPVSGMGLMMSFDLDLQLETAKALAGKQAAAIALDPNNGQVLAMVSLPGLDPNIFAGVVKGDQMADFMERDDKPFLDRSLAEHYPPGSTFKLAIASAALEQGVIDENTTYFCPGYYKFGNRVWKCWDKQGHGRVNVVQAIERSCDVFFYNVGLALGLDSIYQWAARFGFGRRSFLGNEVFPGKLETLFRFNSEQPGFIPNSEWVLSRRSSSVEAEIINASIGQGAVTVTLMQLARMASIIANGGRVYQPQLVLSTVGADGKPLQSFESKLENDILFKPKTLELVRRGMSEVVNGSLGTARASKISGLIYGGKTGTAQVAALNLTKKFRSKSLEDHSLFVAVAPIENPKIAVAVIVENGGHGSSGAAPVGKLMIQTYLKDLIAKERNHEK